MMIIELSEQARIDLTHSPYDTEGLGVAILGNKGSGKSNILAVMVEEAHRGQVPFVFFDPNGDACSLRELGEDVVVIGDPGHDEAIRRADYPLEVARRDPGSFIEMILKEGYNLVVDLTEGDNPEFSQLTFQALINEHFKRAGKLRTPAFVFVDEAHQYAPQSNANKLEKQSLRALGKVASDGRKRGMMLVVATQRPTYLSKRIIFGVNVRIFGKVTYWPDYNDVVRHYIPISFQQMKGLRSGEVFIFGDNIFREMNLGKVRVRRRKTKDLGATPLVQPRSRPERPSKVRQLQLDLSLE
jgi:DNA helicase HerA-like ATPase